MGKMVGQSTHLSNVHSYQAYLWCHSKGPLSDSCTRNRCRWNHQVDIVLWWFNFYGHWRILCSTKHSSASCTQGAAVYAFIPGFVSQRKITLTGTPQVHFLIRLRGSYLALNNMHIIMKTLRAMLTEPEVHALGKILVNEKGQGWDDEQNYMRTLLCTNTRTVKSEIWKYKCKFDAT